MRFLHTSDLHVGRTIRNRSRIDEHRSVLEEIKDIAIAEQVDALLITGDLFHDKRPSLEAQELLAEWLAECARQDTPVVAIAGNHDDPAVLRTLVPWGRLTKITIVPEVVSDLDQLIFALPARDGAESAHIACLPYLPPHQVLSVAEGLAHTLEARMALYTQKVHDYLHALGDRLASPDQRTG